MRKRTYGTGTLRKLPSGKWYLEYKRQSKTVDAANAKAAEKELSTWVQEIDQLNGARPVNVSIYDLIELHKQDMELNDCSPENITDTERKEKKHLGKFFANHDFTKPVKNADITRYKLSRKGKCKPSTVNRELSWLRRCVVLGNKGELISIPIPNIERTDESRFIRTGTVSEEGYYMILRGMPAHSQPVWCMSYRTGVRKGELLKLYTEWLKDWKKAEPYIEIPGFDAKGNRITKSGKPHVIPLWHPEMRAMLEMTLSDPTRNPKCPYLFQYRGKGIKSIRTGFEKARKNAGLDGTVEGIGKVIFHDLRRTAVTNMDALEIDEQEAMEMTGHLTPSMYKRYRIGKASKAVKTGQKLRAATEAAAAQNPQKFTYELTYDRKVMNAGEVN